MQLRLSVLAGRRAERAAGAWRAVKNHGRARRRGGVTRCEPGWATGREAYGAGPARESGLARPARLERVATPTSRSRPTGPGQ